MANITTQTIRVDLSTDKVIPSAFTHQNDTARTLVFDMYNGGLPYTMTGNTVKFAYKSPIVNGQYTIIAGASMASGTVSGNTVSVTLPAAYTAISGVGLLTMIITPTSGTIRPVNIKFIVQKSADGDDSIAGASDFPATLDEIAENWLDENISIQIDDTLSVSGKAADAKVTGDEISELDGQIGDLKSDLNYNHTAEPGYVLRATNTGHGNEWAMVGTPTDAQAEEAINNWLDDHPEATTTVQDGSLTVAKFTDALKLSTVKDYLTPEMFGAKGDGVTDDTAAIVSAFNACKTEGKFFVCPAKRYITTVNCVLNYESYEFNTYVLGEVDFIEFVGAPTKMSAITIEVEKATTINFKNFKGISAHVGYAETLNVQASTTNGSAYNNFQGGYAKNLVLKGLIANAWVNENKFYDFRVVNLSILGNSYQNNNNRFYDLAIEGGTITLNGANSNYIQIRGEGNYTVAGNSQKNNIIEVTFLDAKANMQMGCASYGDFSFSSVSVYKYMKLVEIFRLDKFNMPLYDERNIRIEAWKDIVTIYVRMKQPMSVVFDSSDTVRYSYTILDSQFNNITTSNADTCGAKSSGTTFSSTANAWSRSANTNSAIINAYDADTTHWLAVTFKTGDGSYIAPSFSVFVRCVLPPDYFIGSSVLDTTTET